MIIASFIKILYGLDFFVVPSCRRFEGFAASPMEVQQQQKRLPQSLFVRSSSLFFKYLAIGRHHPSTSQCRLLKRIRIRLISTADAESAFWCQGLLGLAVV